MENEAMEWLKFGATLLGGGAMGAFITTIVTDLRNRIQPIGKRVHAEILFAPGTHVDNHLTRITVSGNTEQHHFENLYLVKIEMRNIGNKDYSEFKCGLTLPSYARFVTLNAAGPDRHHVILPSPEIRFDTPGSNIVDLTLKPFNRKDSYEVNLFVTCDSGQVLPSIAFSSDMPIKFKEMESLSNVTLDIALSVLSSSLFNYTYEVFRKIK